MTNLISITYILSSGCKIGLLVAVASSIYLWLAFWVANYFNEDNELIPIHTFSGNWIILVFIVNKEIIKYC